MGLSPCEEIIITPGAQRPGGEGGVQGQWEAVFGLGESVWRGCRQVRTEGGGEGFGMGGGFKCH